MMGITSCNCNHLYFDRFIIIHFIIFSCVIEKIARFSISGQTSFHDFELLSIIMIANKLQMEAKTETSAQNIRA